MLEQGGWNGAGVVLMFLQMLGPFTPSASSCASPNLPPQGGGAKCVLVDTWMPAAVALTPSLREAPLPPGAGGKSLQLPRHAKALCQKLVVRMYQQSSELTAAQPSADQSRA